MNSQSKANANLLIGISAIIERAQSSILYYSHDGSKADIQDHTKQKHKL